MTDAMSARGDRPTDARRFSGAALEAAETGSVLDALGRLAQATTTLVGCSWAVIGVLDEDANMPARSWASTDDGLVEEMMRISSDAGTSPGWDLLRDPSLRQSDVVVCDDLEHETRYPGWAAAVVAQTPVRSSVAAAFRLHDELLPIGLLCAYADRPRAFGAEDVDRVALLADHCSLVVNRAVSVDRAVNLTQALVNARVIGAAVGILMERHRLTYDDAFARLVRASQLTQRKLHAVAEELTSTGALPSP